MAFGGGVQAIDGFSSDDQSGIKAESDLGGVQIVVDGLRHAHNFHSFAEEIERDVLRPIAADHNHGVDPETARVIHAQRRVVMNDLLAVFRGFVGERIAAIGGPENGASARQNSADCFLGHVFGAFRPYEPVETIANSDDAHGVVIDGAAHDCAYDRVQPGSVSAAVYYPDGANWFHGTLENSTGNC